MGSRSGRVLDSSTGSLADHSDLEMILGHDPSNDERVRTMGDVEEGQYVTKLHLIRIVHRMTGEYSRQGGQ